MAELEVCWQCYLEYNEWQFVQMILQYNWFCLFSYVHIGDNPVRVRHHKESGNMVVECLSVR